MRTHWVMSIPMSKSRFCTAEPRTRSRMNTARVRRDADSTPGPSSAVSVRCLSSSDTDPHPRGPIASPRQQSALPSSRGGADPPHPVITIHSTASPGHGKMRPRQNESTGRNRCRSRRACSGNPDLQKDHPARRTDAPGFWRAVVPLAAPGRISSPRHRICPVSRSLHTPEEGNSSCTGVRTKRRGDANWTVTRG